LDFVSCECVVRTRVYVDTIAACACDGVVGEGVVGAGGEAYTNAICCNSIVGEGVVGIARKRHSITISYNVIIY
jgi:hypothetical protein